MKFEFKAQIVEVGDIPMPDGTLEGVTLDVNGNGAGKNTVFALDRQQILEAARHLYGWVTITIEIADTNL